MQCYLADASKAANPGATLASLAADWLNPQEQTSGRLLASAVGLTWHINVCLNYLNTDSEVFVDFSYSQSLV